MTKKELLKELESLKDDETVTLGQVTMEYDLKTKYFKREVHCFDIVISITTLNQKLFVISPRG